MPGYGHLSYESQNLHGYEHVLSAQSVGGEYKVEMNIVDSVVWATVDGGVWFPFLGAGGVVVTLQQAYDGGGAVGSGLGRSALSINSGPVLLFNTAANGNSVLQVSKSPPGAAAGNAIDVTLGALATGHAISVTMDTTNVNSAALLCTANATTGVSHGAIGLRYLRTVTPAAASEFRGLGVFIDNRPGGGNAYVEAGVLIDVNHQPISALATDTTIGLRIAMTPAAANLTQGIVVSMGVNATGSALVVTLANGASQESVWVNTTATTLSGGGHRELLITRQQTFTTSQTQSRSAFSILSQSTLNDAGAGTQTLTLNGVLLEIAHAPVLTSGLAIADTTTAISVTVTPATAASAVRGVLVMMGANTSSAGYAATFDWRGTAGTVAGNGIVNITNENLAANLTGPLTGLEIDISDANQNNQALTGLRVVLPVNSNAGTFGIDIATAQGQGNAIRVVNSSAAGHIGSLVSLAQTDASYAATTGMLFVSSTGTFSGVPAIQITTTQMGMRISSTATGANSLECAQFAITNTTANTGGMMRLTRSSAYTTGGTVGSATIQIGKFLACTETGAINVGAGTVTWLGSMISLNHAPTITGGTYVADGYTGLQIVITPPASAGVQGITVTMGANTSNAGYAAKFDWRATAGTAAGNAIVNIEIGAATTFTGQIVGLEIDISTNVTGGGQSLFGQRVVVGNSTAAVAAATSACLRTDYRNPAGTSNGYGIIVAEVGAATTLTGQLVGVKINLDTNVTSGGNACVCLEANTCVGAAGIGAQLYHNSTSGQGARIVMQSGGVSSGVGLEIVMGANYTNTAAYALAITVNAANEATVPYIDLGGMSMFVDDGVPNNANGANGDLYWQRDGVAATRLYSKDAGVWIPIA